MRRSILVPFVAGISVVALVVGGFALVRARNAGSLGIDPTAARTMALSTRIDGNVKAPEFTLTDQHGRTVSLTSLRGKATVLTFLDPHCTDVCPIISAEFVQADRLLGADRDHVAIVSVNVNPYATSTADVLAYDREHQLAGLANFSFLTGSATTLARVWKDYGVYVRAPDPTADVVHTSITYFLDPTGVVRYVAMPNVDHHSDGSAYLPQGTIDTWATGIA